MGKIIIHILFLLIMLLALVIQSANALDVGFDPSDVMGDEDNMTNIPSNFSYTPSGMVLSFHNVPHIGNVFVFILFIKFLTFRKTPRIIHNFLFYSSTRVFLSSNPCPSPTLLPRPSCLLLCSHVIGYYRECILNCTGVNGSAIPRSMMHMGPRKWGVNPHPKFMSMPEEARKRGDIKPQQKGETDEAYKQRIEKETAIKDTYIDMAHDSDDYWLTLLPFSIFIGFLGLLSLVFLELGINDYCTWLVPKLGPKELDPEDETITAMALYTHANEVSRKNWLLYFSIAMVVAVFGTNFVWYGNYMFDSGFKQFDESLDSIGDRLFAMSTDVTELKDKLSITVQLATTASQTTCPEAAVTLPNMAKLGTFLAAFADQVAMIATFSDKVHDNLYIYNDYKNKVLYSVYFVASSMLLSFFVIFWFRKQEYMRYTIYVSQAGMVILLALAVLEFMGMVFISLSSFHI